MINSGANDRGTDSDVFTAEYKKLIETVRRVNPGCRIWIVTPFCGAFRRELSEIAEADKALTYIDTAPWKIPAEPLHPSPHYHRLAAEKLAAAIMENLSRDSLAE